MDIHVGDSFTLDGTKWSIKLVDLDGTHPKNKTGEPRVDASRFYTDEFGDEKVKKGRPSKFKVEDVCRAMGINVPETATGFAFQPEFVDEGPSEEELRASRERVEKLLDMIPDDATVDQW